MDKKVEAWFDALPDDKQSVARKLRTLIQQCDSSFTESLKWSRPCYSLNGLVCYLHKTKDHVVLGFQHGAHLPDPDNLLEGTGKDMRHIKFAPGARIEQSSIKKLLKAAIKHDSSA